MASPRSITENGSLFLAQQATRKSASPLPARFEPRRTGPSQSRVAKFFRALIRTRKTDAPKSLFAFAPLGRLGSARDFSEAEKSERMSHRQTRP